LTLNSHLDCRAARQLEVDFSLPAERVIRCLDRIIEWRGKPGTIRSNKALPSSTSNQDSLSRTPASNVKTAQSGTSGLTNTTAKASRKLKTSPRNGYGHTTATAQTRASAALPGASPVLGGNDPLDRFLIALTPHRN
jgi:putative transposase